MENYKERENIEQTTFQQKDSIIMKEVYLLSQQFPPSYSLNDLGNISYYES